MIRSPIGAGRRLVAVVTLVIVACCGAAHGDEVAVVATGVVEFNLVTNPPLGGAAPGTPVTLSFFIDSNFFLDGGSFSTRGYEIDSGTFSFTLGTLELVLQTPFPAAETPYFVLRDDDPGVDGFFVGTSVDFPNGLPLDVTGMFGAFRNNFSVTYTGDTLDSLEVLDALGSYDFMGLTVFNWTVDDGPAQPVGILFESLTLSVIPGGVVFLRGDGDGDGTFNGLADALHVLAHQFQGGPPPICLEGADADGDGTFNGLIDGLHILGHQFQSGPPPPEPYPFCGLDPDPDTSLGCEVNGCP